MSADRRAPISAFPPALRASGLSNLKPQASKPQARLKPPAFRLTASAPTLNKAAPACPCKVPAAYDSSKGTRCDIKRTASGSPVVWHLSVSERESAAGADGAACRSRLCKGLWASCSAAPARQASAAGQGPRDSIAGHDLRT